MFSIILSSVLAIYQEASQTPILEPNNPIQIEFGPRESETWRIQARARDRVEGFLLQGGSDFDVVIANPEGAELPPFDFSSAGYEPFRFRASSTGDYHLTVRNRKNRTGSADLFLGLCEPEAIESRKLADQYLSTFPNHHPGAGFVSVLPSGEIYIQTMGSLGPDIAQRFSADSRIPVVALELPLARLGLLHLVSEKGIALDTPVSELAALPQLDRRVQLIHLLREQTGMRKLKSLWLLREGVETLPTKRLSYSQCNDLIAQQSELNFEPGRGSDGWNTQAPLTAMQRICARLSGKNYDEFVNETVVTLLGMHNTRVKRLETGPKYRIAEWNWEHSKSSWILHDWLRLGEGDMTVETTLNDTRALILFIESDQELAQLYRQHFLGLVQGWAIGSVSSPNLLTNNRKSSNEVDMLYFMLHDELGTPNSDELSKILASGDWPLEHPGVAGIRPRGGRGSRPLTLEVTTPAIGRYHSKELGLTLEIVAEPGEPQYLRHPAGRDYLLSPTNDRWILSVQGYFLNSLRLGTPQGDGVSEIRLSLSGVNNLRFVRVDDSSAAGD